jgi:hypothetical protein
MIHTILILQVLMRYNMTYQKIFINIHYRFRLFFVSADDNDLGYIPARNKAFYYLRSIVFNG